MSASSSATGKRTPSKHALLYSLSHVTIRWLVTNAQKNALEPILVTLRPGASTEPDDPHEGEEFGYVLSGTITLLCGEQKHRVRRGDAFYFRPTGVHYLTNSGKTEGKVLWVSTPPSF